MGNKTRNDIMDKSIHQVTAQLSDTYALLEQQVSSLKDELSLLSQKRLEELTEKERLAARFAALFDVLPGGVVVLDTHGCVIECNRVAENLMDDSIMGQSWREVLQEFFISPAGNANGILLKNGSVVGVATTSLSDGNGQIVLLTDQTESRQLRHRLVRDKTFMPPVCISQRSKEVFKLAERVSVTNCTVLICGESGTGKEVLARFIHQNSHRSQQPFVAINCAAIPESMLESILFGHEKGAFTGAYQASAGKFELANGGTLLLDEISEMSPALQAKLLRVLQEREVERVGGKKHIALDLRFIATSNRNLAQAIQDGSFREDLYYRLSVFPVFVPPLCERREDIEALAMAFIQKHSPKMDESQVDFGSAHNTHAIELSKAATEKLLNYDWPGNVRELENVVQRALVLCKNKAISANDIVLTDGIHWPLRNAVNRTDKVLIPNGADHASDSRVLNDSVSNKTVLTLNADLRKHEHDRIHAVFRHENGNRKETAIRLGVSERTLRYKLAEMREAGYQL